MYTDILIILDNIKYVFQTFNVVYFKTIAFIRFSTNSVLHIYIVNKLYTPLLYWNYTLQIN